MKNNQPHGIIYISVFDARFMSLSAYKQLYASTHTQNTVVTSVFIDLKDIRIPTIVHALLKYTHKLHC